MRLVTAARQLMRSAGELRRIWHAMVTWARYWGAMSGVSNEPIETYRGSGRRRIARRRQRRAYTRVSAASSHADLKTAKMSHVHARFGARDKWYMGRGAI
jgi:hypothetical protein